jgi:hypothetical protein
VARKLLIVVVGLIVAACGASPGKPGPSSVATPGAATPTHGPASTPTPVAHATPGAASPVDYGFQLVLLARADDWAVVTSNDQEIATSLRAGVPTANWMSVYSATPTASGTQVKESFVEGGDAEHSWSLDGAWAIPMSGIARTPTGLSGDGRTLILVEANPSAAQTRFAVLNTQSAKAPRILSLPGRFAFDAISPTASHFYVIEQRDAEAGYFVRSVNTQTGSLDEGVIVDKREVAEVMAGIAIEQRSGIGGTVYTLYQGPEHPFVHMLLTQDRSAFCIDLPAAWGNDQANAFGWSLALSVDSSHLFVANAALGVAGEVDTNSLNVVRTTSFAPTATFQLAKFGGGRAGPLGGGMVLSPDEATLYLADGNGILAIATSDLAVKGRLLQGTAVASLGMASNGNVLYVVGRDGNAMRVDPRNGAVISRLSGTGYTAVLRVVSPE